MSAGIYTTGAINHFVRFNKPVLGYGTSTAYYLGTAVLAPDQEAHDAKIPILNDLGGRSVPFQLVQDGEQWTILSTLNRFDIDVYRAMRALIGTGPGGAGFVALGSENALARGTLVIGSSDFQLILQNTYAGTPSAGLGLAPAPPVTLNATRAFYSCTLLDYREETKGTRVLEIALAMQANNVFDPFGRGFSLYSELGSGAPGPVT